MTDRRERKPKRWEQYQCTWEISALRTDEPIGIYPRLSTMRRKKNNRQSLEKQTIDAVKDAIARGWDESLIKVYDQDIGTSAARPLEQREAISQMIEDDILKQRYSTETPETILNALPRRTWDACIARVTTIPGLKRQASWKVKDCQLSKEDIQVIERYQIPSEHMPSGGVLCVNWLC